MTNVFEDLNLHPSDDRGHLLTEAITQIELHLTPVTGFWHYHLELDPLGV